MSDERIAELIEKRDYARVRYDEAFGNLLAHQISSTITAMEVLGATADVCALAVKSFEEVAQRCLRHGYDRGESVGWDKGYQDTVDAYRKANRE